MSKSPKSKNALQSRWLRHIAACVLDQNGARNRLTLVLGLIAVMALGLTVPVLLDCLWLVSAVLGGNVGKWIEMIRMVLSCASIVFLTLPLMMGLYGMAAEMAQTCDCLSPETLMPPKVELYRIFDAFASPKAYARSLVAGLQSVGRLAAVVLVPYVLVALSNWLLMPSLEAMVKASAYSVILVARGLLAIAIAALIWLMGCRRRGYAYLVLTNPTIPLREIGRKFRSVRQPLAEAARMSLGTAGRVFLAAIPVLIPLLVHTLPSLMIASAVYAEEVFDKGANEQTEE